MKKSLLLLLPLLVFMLVGQHLCKAQKAIIDYTEVMKLEIDLGDMDPKMKEMFPSSQSYPKQLKIDGTASIYENVKEDNDLSIQQSDGGMDIDIDIRMPQSYIYINSNKNERIQYQEFLGREFLILDNDKRYEWKILGEQKRVLDYVCQKASLITEGDEVVAWFAPALQYDFGPMGFNGLPGLILALDMDEGRLKVVATNVALDVQELTIEKPEKGKKVSREEYEKIRDEKMKEMGMNMDGGTAIKVIIEDDARN
jgi:GLPGLI family protein